jgi:hypothetical protein
MLPDPYERWYVEMCGRPSPVETRATCDDCAMLPGAPSLPPEGAFDPALRCCTHHPHLAAHFVGGILDGDDPHGRAVVRARIAARVGVTPLGIAQPPGWPAQPPPGAFGHSTALRCPFLDGARCSIWRHRGTVCAAFHCKFDRGALGAGLWKLIQLAFATVERVVARWALERAGLELAACEALLRAPGDPALEARAWGGWHGREEPFFVDAARAVAQLSWSDIAALGARELGGLGAAMRGALERLDALKPPARVRRNPEILHHIRLDGGARLQNVGVLLDVIDVDARTAAALAALGESSLDALGLDEELTQRLLDWQVLLPA